MSRDNRQIQNKKPPMSDGSVLYGRLGVLNRQQQLPQQKIMRSAMMMIQMHLSSKMLQRQLFII